VPLEPPESTVPRATSKRDRELRSGWQGRNKPGLSGRQQGQAPTAELHEVPCGFSAGRPPSLGASDAAAVLPGPPAAGK